MRFRKTLQIVAVSLLTAVTFSACATLEKVGIGSSRKAKIVNAPCPPEKLWKESEWISFDTKGHGEAHALLDVHFRELAQWIRDWQTCAKARGVAIEEVNR